MKWTRDHKSHCGRFWCYKPPRSDEWQLWDRLDKDARGNAKVYRRRKLSECKGYAEYIIKIFDNPNTEDDDGKPSQR